MDNPQTAKNEHPRVMVLVGDWVEDYEAFVPIKALEMLGIQVDIVSPGKVKGQFVMTCIHDFDRSNIDGGTDTVIANAFGITKTHQIIQFQAVSERFGHALLITKDFDKVKIEEYDGIFLPGGRSPETLQLDATVIAWTQHVFGKGKPVAALCHGVQVLATAGVLNGRTCTGHPCCRCQAEMGGAHWTATNLIDTVIDGNLITAAEWTGLPDLIGKFAQALGYRWNFNPSDKLASSTTQFAG